MNIGLKYLLTFLVSMAPIVELRGAVPFGVGMGLRVLPVLIVCIIGNMIPVPFIALFIRRIFAFLRSRSKKLDDLVSKIELRAHEKAKTIKKYERWGLYIFVAIPLPGTGAWTGALLAALLNMRLKDAFPSIAIGVVTAGLIMLFGSSAVDWLIALFV